MNTKQTRATLKNYFVTNATPTQENFAELIDAPINQADDGMFKAKGEPLSVVAGSAGTKPVLRLYADFPGNPDWVVNLQSGLSLASGDGVSRLQLDSKGNLTVGGGLAVGGDSTVGGGLKVAGLAQVQRIAVNHDSNNGASQGVWLWHKDNSSHVIYSASTSGTSPRGGAVAKGFFENGKLNLTGRTEPYSDHRLRLRTHINQGFLFENDNEERLVDISARTGDIWTKGDLFAGGSAVFFADAGHRVTSFADPHSNTNPSGNSGWAAIQNDGYDYKALMILGRSTDKGRIVKLWDYLEVNGSLHVNGPDSQKPRVQIGRWVLEAEGSSLTIRCGESIVARFSSTSSDHIVTHAIYSKAFTVFQNDKAGAGMPYFQVASKDAKMVP